MREYDEADELEKDEIVYSLEKSRLGDVMIAGQAVLSREDYEEYEMKMKSVRGILNNVDIDFNKVGRIVQEGSLVLEDGDLADSSCLILLHDTYIY